MATLPATCRPLFKKAHAVQSDVFEKIGRRLGICAQSRTKGPRSLDRIPEAIRRSPGFNARICAAVVASLLCGAAASPPPSRSQIRRLVTEDQCLGVRGYAAFRGELERAAKEQDFTAFRNLFHPRGTARLDSVRIGPGGRLDTAPRLDFWRTLD